MDGLKELVEAFSARIKSPIVGSIVLAFVIVNWKPLFFLLFSGEPAVAKFAFYDGNTTGCSRYLYPVGIGLAFALILPWVNFWGAKAIKLPVVWHRNMQLDVAHNLEQNKMRYVIDRETDNAAYRDALLENAISKQNFKNADLDPDVRADLEDKLVKVKEGELVNAPDLGAVQKPLSDTHVAFLASAAKSSSGRVSFGRDGENYYMRYGTFENSGFGYTIFEAKDAINRKAFLIAKEIIGELSKNRYMEQVSESEFDITTVGYSYLDSLDGSERKAK